MAADGFAPLIFTHIQKTGGNTVAATLRGLRKHQRWNTLSIAGGARQHSPEKVLELMSVNRVSVRHFNIITGHIPFATAITCFAPGVFITVLREPIDRLLSDYCSQPSNQSNKEFNLTEFAALISTKPNPEFLIDNLHVRMLCDFPRFDEPVTASMLDQAKRNIEQHYLVAGVTKDLPAFNDNLCQALGCPPTDVLQLGETPSGYHQYVTGDIRDLARRHNEYDLELYAWVLDRSKPKTFDAEAASSSQVLIKSVPFAAEGPRTITSDEVRFDGPEGLELLLAYNEPLKVWKLADQGPGGRLADFVRNFKSSSAKIV